MTEPIKRRRWFRFSLRILFVVVTVLCVWLGFKVNAARRQKEAVEAVLKAGGKVLYDYQISPTRPGEYSWTIRFNPNPLPGGPEFLRKIFGDDCFRTAVVVFWSKSDVPEPVFRQLTNLPELTVLSLKGVKIVPNGSNVPRPIQDSDFAVFAQLSRLVMLELVVSDAKGSGFAHLTKLQNLRNLVIVNAVVNDTGMESVGEIRQLERLELSNNPITDEGLKHLQHLVNLTSLWLQANMGITDVGLKDLQKSLPNCKMFGP